MKIGVDIRTLMDKRYSGVRERQNAAAAPASVAASQQAHGGSFGQLRLLLGYRKLCQFQAQKSLIQVK